MQYMASPEALQNIVFWTMGSLAKANWINISIVLIVLAIMLPLMMRESWRLTALKLGDEKASGLGVNVESLRVKVFAFISIITAVAVSFVGTIGFIGIVGPHIARMLVGEDQRYFLPLSAYVAWRFDLSHLLRVSARSWGDVPNRYCDGNHRCTFLLLVGIN